MGVTLNPSSFVGSPLSFDVNVGSGGGSVDNTFLYIPKDDLTFFGFGNIVDIVKNKEYLSRWNPDIPMRRRALPFPQKPQAPLSW
jgi:hypothetical protein